MAAYLKTFAIPQKALARKTQVRKIIKRKQRTPETLKEAAEPLQKAQASRQGVNRRNSEAMKSKEKRVKLTQERRSESGNPKRMGRRKTTHMTGARISQS